MRETNQVTLIDYMGSDKAHALAAWASTFLELNIEMPKDPKIRVDQIVDHILSKSKRMRSLDELLLFLATNEHESPFRMSSFMFTMTTDIATHIQKLKHAVILEAENAESARYKLLKEDKYYLPEDWKGIPISTTSQSKLKEVLEYSSEADWKDILRDFTELSNSLYKAAYNDLKEPLGAKRAKESARFFKTYNSQINSINKFSFAGIVTFYKKRNTSHAQKEIAEVAVKMLDEVRNLPNNPFKYTLKAFNL